MIRAGDVLSRVPYGPHFSTFWLSSTLRSHHRRSRRAPFKATTEGGLIFVFQRFIEIWSSMPTMLIILASLIQPTFYTTGIYLLFAWMGYVGCRSAGILRGRNFEYVQAARAMGMSDRRIMFNILPNALVATLDFYAFTLSGSFVS